MDSNDKHIISFFTKTEVNNFLNAYNAIIDNENFYNEYKSTTTQIHTIHSQLKKGYLYRSFNSAILVDIGWFLAKQSLNEDWTRKGALNSFNIFNENEVDLANKFDKNKVHFSTKLTVGFYLY